MNANNGFGHSAAEIGEPCEKARKARFPSRLNGRQRALASAAAAAAGIAAVWIAGAFIQEDQLATSLAQRNLPPSLFHPFGTDWLGRDMFLRTLKGLAVSINVGLAASAASVLIAAAMGIAAAAFGKTADRIVSWLIDLFLSVPHLVTLILVSFAMGGGMKGIVIGLALTHWPSLARLVRAEVMQLSTAEYVRIARKLGRSRLQVAFAHMVPHLVPQLAVGMLLLFPHAILHEAALTFIGLGLSPHQPAVGVILSESMRYLSTGMWWLAFFPGLALLLIVRGFGIAGERLRQLADPRHARE